MIVVFFSAVILGIVFQRSKFITIVQLTICAVIFSINTDNPDYSGYLGTYNSVKEGGIYWDYFQRYDPLYKLLVRISNGLGLNFNAFRLFVFLLCMLFAYSGIKKLTKRTSFVTSLYMLFPFVMDCIQLRNFIAEAIIVFSVRYLVNPGCLKNRRKNMIKYALCVVIASMFHYVSAVYIIFIIVFFRKRFDTFFKLGLSASALLSLGLYFTKRRMVSDTGYFATSVSIVTFLFLSIITVGLALILKYYMTKSNRGRVEQDQVIQYIIRYLKVTTIFIPMIIFHYDMFRFIRNLLFVFSGFAGYYLSKVKIMQGKRGVAILSSVVVCFFYIACYGLLLWRSAYYPYDISLIDQIMNSVVVSW